MFINFHGYFMVLLVCLGYISECIRVLSQPKTFKNKMSPTTITQLKWGLPTTLWSQKRKTLELDNKQAKLINDRVLWYNVRENSSISWWFDRLRFPRATLVHENHAKGSFPGCGLQQELAAISPNNGKSSSVQMIYNSWLIKSIVYSRCYIYIYIYIYSTIYIYIYKEYNIFV